MAYQQWQNGLAKSLIGSINLLTSSQMAESGMGERFWFRAMVSGKDAQNDEYIFFLAFSLFPHKRHISPSPPLFSPAFHFKVLGTQ